jgi:hypothetical protein
MADSSLAQTLREEMLKAIRLPQTAQEAREAGVADEDIKTALKEAKSRKVKAADMQEGLEETVNAAREHGPIDNFGAFVRSRLDQGFRGRALAEAIRQEHASRGMGKVQGKAMEKAEEKDAQDAPARGKGMEKREEREETGMDSGDRSGRGQERPGGQGQGKAQGKGKGRPE